MIYNLALSREDFDKADRLVRATLRRNGPQLRLITSDSAELTPTDRDYVQQNTDCLGVCFSEDDVFDIWISPSLKDPSNSFYRDTVLHELCHGYLGEYTHNVRWRRFFGKILYHYSDLVYPLKVNPQVSRMITRYTRTGKTETASEYRLRREYEHGSIALQAMEEVTHVSRVFTRMEARSV